MATTIGLISDTHGLVRLAALEAFRGVSTILHAGDVGGDDVLVELSTLGPVHAVRGNVDPVGHPRLPRVYRHVAEGLSIVVVHGHEHAPVTPAKLAAAFRADAIVFGHTHRAVVERVGGTLVVNPGSAGPRRFDLGPSVAVLSIDAGRMAVEIVPIE
ncbi:MAG: metallophosphoesterase [Vicinamibacterales bacterium]